MTAAFGSWCWISELVGGRVKHMGLSPWRQSTLAREFDLFSGEQMVGSGRGRGSGNPGNEQERV